MSLPVRERGLKHIEVVCTAHRVKSLPVRERGLKQNHGYTVVADLKVAPRAGAWIETVCRCEDPIPLLSLPVRERGLKQEAQQMAQQVTGSLPVRERGLKLLETISFALSHGRSPCGSVD